jgi:hypothetical protein
MLYDLNIVFPPKFLLKLNSQCDSIMKLGFGEVMKSLGLCPYIHEYLYKRDW